jgi:hypothetical protein
MAGLHRDFVSPQGRVIQGSDQDCSPIAWSGPTFLSLANRLVPVEDLFTGPHKGVVPVADMLEDTADFTRPVGDAHNVGVQGKAHDTGRARLGGGVFDQLIEFPDGPVAVFLGPVALNKLHRQIVEFLSIGQAHHRTVLGPQLNRLIVHHPVGHILEACVMQPVHGIVGLGQRRSQPSLGRLAGIFLQLGEHPMDHVLLILDSGQGPLDPAMAAQVPAGVEAGIDDLRIDVTDRAVEHQSAARPELVEDALETPEADALAIFVPGPVWNVGHGLLDAAGRIDNRARHRRVDHPVLHIDAGPDHNLAAFGQRQGLASVNRLIADTVCRPVEAHDGSPCGLRGPAQSGRMRVSSYPTPSQFG